MTYKSLFDMVLEKYHPKFLENNQMKWNGTLDEIMSQTEKMLNSGRRKSNALALALHVPRIIRGFVDYKIGFPGEGGEELVRDSIDLGLNIYEGNKTLKEQANQLGDFREKLRKKKLTHILEARVVQPYDSITWKATNPDYSAKTSRSLSKTLNGENLLFIAMANGGVAAGMDTYLRYCDTTQNTDSLFYVVRFSHRKAGDDSPRLTSSEIEYLKDNLGKKKLVIFDEDSFTGKTLIKAHEFFSTEVFPGFPIIALANLYGDSKKARHLKY